MRHDLDLLGAKDPKNVPVAIRISGDTPGTYEYALTCPERRWLEETLKKHGRGQVTLDLGKKISKLVMTASDGPLFTIMRGAGRIWNDSANPPRWLHPLELLTSQGWPICDEHVEACGAACNFSRNGGVHNPARNRSTLSAQCGNAMHVNSIGGIIFGTLVRFPRLVDALREGGGVGASVAPNVASSASYSSASSASNLPPASSASTVAIEAQLGEFQEMLLLSAGVSEALRKRGRDA